MIDGLVDGFYFDRQYHRIVNQLSLCKASGQDSSLRVPMRSLRCCYLSLVVHLSKDVHLMIHLNLQHIRKSGRFAHNPPDFPNPVDLGRISRNLLKIHKTKDLFTGHCNILFTFYSRFNNFSFWGKNFVSKRHTEYSIRRRQNFK